VPYRRIRNIIPYVSAGLGPYWISEINSRDNFHEDEVTVKSRVKPGAYLGGGFNFGLSDRFAINFDLKYHLIDLELNHKYSGFEYGVGFTIFWGKFK
jgi:outer membrane protein W